MLPTPYREASFTGLQKERKFGSELSGSHYAKFFLQSRQSETFSCLALLPGDYRLLPARVVRGRRASADQVVKHSLVLLNVLTVL